MEVVVGSLGCGGKRGGGVKWGVHFLGTIRGGNGAAAEIFPRSRATRMEKLPNYLEGLQ